MEKTQCRVCRKEINKEAKKCYHCLSWQTKWGIDLYNPRTSVLFIFFLLFIFIPIFIMFISKWEGYLRKTEKQSDISFRILKITESSLETCQCGDSKCVAILGTIKNESNHLWKNLHFHADLLDSNSQLIDTFSENDYDIIVPANSSTTFRISKLAIRELSEYSRHEISIRWARKID